MKIFYMGLESYESRYTLQLTKWATTTMDRRGARPLITVRQFLWDRFLMHMEEVISPCHK